LTGSIGVFSVVPTFQRTLEKFGVKVDGIGTTPLAGDMRLDRALDVPTRQILQSSVDHAYAEFLRRVGDGRKKSVEDVDKIAQGRVWAGVDGQRIGLVDHLGGLKDATDAAAKLAELGADYDVDYIESELSLREQIMMQLRAQVLRLGRMAGLAAPRSDIEQALDPLLEQVRAIAQLNDPRGLYAYCWCKEPPGARRMLFSR
jgi:protease-4